MKTNQKTWIAIKDKMPDEHIFVMCYGNPNNGGFHTTINTYCGNGIFRHWESEKENKSLITHWANLPEPPK